MDADATGPDRERGADAVSYRERLLAPLWLWLVCAAIVASLAIAYAVALGTFAGLLLAAVLGAITVWLLMITAPTILVTTNELRVGRAHIDWSHVGLVATLDAASADLARGRDADPRAFAVSRTLTTRTAITIEVIDDEDPHPYWLISTRRPEQLGQAITGAQHTARLGSAAR